MNWKYLFNKKLFGWDAVEICRLMHTLTSAARKPYRLFGDAEEVSLGDGIWVITVFFLDIYTFSF